MLLILVVQFISFLSHFPEEINESKPRRLDTGAASGAGGAGAVDGRRSEAGGFSVRQQGGSPTGSHRGPSESED